MYDSRLTPNSHKPLDRASKNSLKDRNANFSLDGLKFHFQKLNQYTNPTGGALDKRWLNNKAYTAAFYDQFKSFPAPKSSIEPAPWHDDTPNRPFFLRTKAQYQVANHLLGLGQVAYWTGAIGKTTLLGLDIDDHESTDPYQVQTNAQKALDLFVELTRLHPTPCKSQRGINAFLICQKFDKSTAFINEAWHALIRAIDKQAKSKNLAATIECKGKARIFTEDVQYCGVQLKDPLYAYNPTDEEIHDFWTTTETNRVTAKQIHDIVQSLENDLYVPPNQCPSSSRTDMNVGPFPDNELLPVYRGNWAQKVHEWASLGLPCTNSIYPVTSELSKWLLFIEGHDVSTTIELLQTWIKQKHNGMSTRINRGQEGEVLSQIERIVKAQTHKDVFDAIKRTNHTSLVPVLIDPPNQCLSPSRTDMNVGPFTEWLPAPEYRRKRAEQWAYEPDDTRLPEKLSHAIEQYYRKKSLTIHKPTWMKMTRFLNHLWTNNPEHEARLGVDTLSQKLGFGKKARKHIKHLEQLGAIESQGYCPAAGVSKLYRLTPAAIRMFEAENRIVTKS